MNTEGAVCREKVGRFERDQASLIMSNMKPLDIKLDELT